MAIELDHVIVSAKNRAVSAKRLAELLGVRWAESGAGPFSPVYVNDGLTLDFIEDDEPFPVQHFCFRVDDKGFDAILERIRAAGIKYRSTVRGRETCKSIHSTAAAWSTGTSPTGINGRCSR